MNNYTNRLDDGISAFKDFRIAHFNAEDGGARTAIAYHNQLVVETNGNSLFSEQEGIGMLADTPWAGEKDLSFTREWDKMVYADFNYLTNADAREWVVFILREQMTPPDYERVNEFAAEIQRIDYWDPDLLEELCVTAGLAHEWFTEHYFEPVVYLAADILEVKLG